LSSNATGIAPVETTKTSRYPQHYHLGSK